MHKLCGQGNDAGCQFECFKHLQHHLDRYAAELSRVLFRKKNLQSDRRWWLSVFYSLYVQAYVRRVLITIQSHTDHENLYADWSRYCHTPLVLFKAAAAGWDPISSKDDTSLPPVGSDNDAKLYRHISVARDVIRAVSEDDYSHDTRTSSGILWDLFECQIQLELEDSRPYYHGGTKRRANSPPQGDEAMRRASTDNLSLRSSASSCSSGRASSFASINSAYGALNFDTSVDRPSSDQISPSSVPSGVLQPYNHDLVDQRTSSSPALRLTPSLDPGSTQDFFMCDCCPKKPKRFATREELR